MPTAFIDDATRYIESQEGQAVLRELAKHGLGAFVPHMHDEQGDFQQLPPGIAQVERNLRVTFEPDHLPEVIDALTVGWLWDTELKSVRRCVKCPVTGHHG